jgi:glycine/D-amino acid oxidase-like deaminating enzyme
MVDLMNRSIDLMETLARESGNIFHLNRRGYLYCTGQLSKVQEIQHTAQEISAFGAGQLRVHNKGIGKNLYSPAQPHVFEDQPGGADLILDPQIIRDHYPYLSEEVVAILHIRRAGWFSAQQMGMHMLERARSEGVRVLRGKVTGVDLAAGRVASVQLEDGSRVDTSIFVNAAGPLIKDVARFIGIDLPVSNELHLKAAMKDYLGVLDRSAPMVIWTDSQTLNWSDEERQLIAEDPEYAWMLGTLPGGVHTRPEGGAESQIILLIWEYHAASVKPVWPLPVDPQYPEIALRGIVKVLPGMAAYLGRFARPHIDGGYYTKTVENRPLIGKLPIPGAFVIGALSGFGLMASCAAGELLAAHVTDNHLPAYAPAFSLERYDDPAYQARLESWGDTGQL